MRMDAVGEASAPADGVPASVGLPPEARRHYRHFAWVVHEQRLFMLLLGFLLAACALVWSLALHLRGKPPVVVRAGPSLRDAAAAFTGLPEISYDGMAFFLHGCLPLLFAADRDGHRWLPLAQGLVSREIYASADKRLSDAAAQVRAHGLIQALTVTDVADVVAEGRSRRAAAYVRGYLTVVSADAPARVFPWRGRVLLEVNPVSRLSPWPFTLLRLDQRTGPDAPAWDAARADDLPDDP